MVGAAEKVEKRDMFFEGGQLGESSMEGRTLGPQGFIQLPELLDTKWLAQNVSDQILAR